jgi:hypothetical protein
MSDTHTIRDIETELKNTKLWLVIVIEYVKASIDELNKHKSEDALNLLKEIMHMIEKKRASN